MDASYEFLSNPWVILICLVALFFIVRGINLWYWRVDERISNQKEIIRLLRKIAGEPEPEKPVKKENEDEDWLP